MNSINFFGFIDISSGLQFVQQRAQNSFAYMVAPLSKQHPLADLAVRVGIVLVIGCACVLSGQTIYRRRYAAAITPPAVDPLLLPPAAQASSLSAPPARAQLPPAPASSVLPVQDNQEPFNFAELPEDLQIHVINFLGSSENIQDARRLSETCRTMLRLVYAYQAVWRWRYCAKYHEDMPLVTTNPYLNGREAIQFVHKLRKGEMSPRVCHEPVNICPSSQVLKFGTQSLARCEEIALRNASVDMQLLVGQEQLGFFACQSSAKQAFLDVNEHAILIEESRAFILSKKEIHLLNRERNIPNASWLLPDWAIQFHELQLCGGYSYDPAHFCDRYLCVGIRSSNHNGDMYSYFVINLNKKKPSTLASNLCPHFYFEDGQFPVTIFNHPYIGNKLFFFSQDPEKNSAVYMVDLWSHNQQFSCNKVAQHTKPIVEAAFSIDGRQLIIKDTEGASVAFATTEISNPPV